MHVTNIEAAAGERTASRGAIAHFYRDGRPSRRSFGATFAAVFADSAAVVLATSASRSRYDRAA
jgi:hypothetical protein